MPETIPSFDDLVSRARLGDPAALDQLVKQYEEEVRLVAKLRLGKSPMVRCARRKS